MKLGPRPKPVLASLLLHAAALCWLVLGDLPQPQKPKTLYEQTIAGNEKKLVWYRFKDRLPEVSPPTTESSPDPPRVDTINPKQFVIAKQKNAPPSQQMVWEPAPKIELKQDLQAPNLLAIAPSRPTPRLFTPPRAESAPKALPEIPAAPETSAATALAAPELSKPAKPAPRKFTPPAQTRNRKTAPVIDSTPDLQVAMNLKPGPNLQNPALPVRPAPRTFIPPAAVPGRVNANIQAQEAPAVTASSGGVPATGAPSLARPAAAPRRDFKAPAQGRAAQAPMLAEAPPDVETGGALSAAIVGLKPVEKLTPLPEGARPAQFATGPEKNPKGGDGGAVEGARIVVPDLLIRGGGNKDLRPTLMASIAMPTSRENLMAAARQSMPQPAPPPIARGPHATRVTSSPDPRLEGKIIYTLALQMPNITSYSGSWMMWFADREAKPGQDREITPPVPVRKVDPKYIVTAMEERIEGRVQVSAIIRADGRIDTAWLLKHLDDRLDQSAIEALRKWEFEPARVGGQAIAVDAVFEIPFRLAPRVAK